jgi:hypothetical protein
VAGCTNGVGAPADMIDYGVRVKLNDMLNRNPDAVIAPVPRTGRSLEGLRS